MANGATGAQVSTRQVGVLSRGWPAQAKVVFGKSMPTAGNRWPSGLRRLEATENTGTRASGRLARPPPASRRYGSDSGNTSQSAAGRSANWAGAV